MDKKKILMCGSISYVGQSLIEKLKDKFHVYTYDKIISLDDMLDIDENEMSTYSTIIYLIHDHSNNILKNEYILNLFLNKLKQNQKFIFFSSSQVTENNNNEYTKVKKKLEKVIIEKNNNFLILRPCLMLDKKLNLNNIKKQFLITLLAFLKKYSVAILLANGKFYLNLISIIDVGHLIESCILEDKKNVIININNKESIRFIDLIKLIKNEYKLRIIYIPIPLLCLKLLSIIFPKKISQENIKALKLSKSNFYLNDEITNFDNLKFNNASILKNLFESL